MQKKIRISNGKINFLLSAFDSLDDELKSILQSQIYQKQFQENLKKQLDKFMQDLNSGQYKSITEYLTACYETGYIGAMYDIAGQGIPLVSPIDQKKVTRAMTYDAKLSETLYKRLGIDVDWLKKQVASEISRGIATSSEYKIIARNIDLNCNVGFNRAMRIARTEGHRIQVLSAVDAQHAAKDAGADIVKQWDAALDKRTRPHHRILDGQIRELDEPFEVEGIKVMYPSGFGIAGEDINCRCALLQRAKWMLDDDELERLKQRAAYFGLDKTKDFSDYKAKYLKAAARLYAPTIASTMIIRQGKDFETILTESKGQTKHVNKMRLYSEITECEENVDLPVPFSYNEEKDIIEFNTKHPNFNKYDLNFAKTHELTHRMDLLEYKSYNNQNFINAVQDAKDYVIKNKDEIQETLKKGGKYYDDLAFSDIISALSNNVIEVRAGHENWSETEILLEIFANLSAIDVLGYDSANEIVIQKLMKAYIKVVNQ